jgi:hypothetical protein
MPCTAHIPVPRSQIGNPTEVVGPSGSLVTCMIPPMPCAIRSKPPRLSRTRSDGRSGAGVRHAENEIVRSTLYKVHFIKTELPTSASDL